MSGMSKKAIAAALSTMIGLSSAAALPMTVMADDNGYKTKALVLAFPGSTLKEIENARKDPNSVLSLPLSRHLGNRLYRNGIKTIIQLKELSVDDLAELKDVSYEDILYALSSLNP